MGDRQRHPLLTLFLLTLLAGVLRFAYIDKPAIWGDEAATWRRICGSYQQMVDELRVAGFMPGNYVLTWWIKEGFPISGEFRQGPPGDPTETGFRRRDQPISSGPRLVFTPTHRLFEDGFDPTPLVMRFIPALCGTLMVPAMYFLASRLVARRTALLAAVFTCFSAYLLNYSRDAKMYMQFWFFATLHVGCLLWWLEAYRKRPPAPTHQIVDEGVVGGVRTILPETHIVRIGDAFTVDPARPRATLAGYPSRLETLVRWMCWLTSGLAMIAFNAIGLGVIGIELIIFLATIPLRSVLAGHLIRSLGEPRNPPATENAAPSTPPAASPSLAPAASLAPAPSTYTFRFFIPPVFGFVLGCAAVLALWYSYKDFTRFYQRVNPNDEIARMDLGDAGISWVEPYNEGRTAGGYFLYNATAYLMNWEWVKPEQLDDVDPKALTLLRSSAMALLIAVGAGVVPWRKLLARRRVDPALLQGTSPLTSAFIITCWLLLPAYGLYCASGAWSEDGREINAVAPTQLLVSAIFPGAGNEETRSLAGVLGSELSAARDSRGWAEHDWVQLLIVRGIDFTQARWWLISAIVGALLFMLLDRYHSWRQKAGFLLRVLGVLALFYALALLIYLFTPVQSGSIWMPRYLGFVWPAFAIALCVLVRRLPFKAVRYLVVIALIGVNLGVFYHRVTLGEPRTDLIGRDYQVARESGSIRMFSRSLVSRWRGAPGYGSMVTLPSVYYASLYTHQPMTPSGAIGQVRRSLDLDPLGADYIGGIRVRLDRDPSAREFFFWIERPVDESGDLDPALRDKLGAQWGPAEPPATWTVYEHWTWRKLYRLERHHWIQSPSTQPATAPTTRTTPTTRATPATPTSRAQP